MRVSQNVLAIPRNSGLELVRPASTASSTGDHAGPDTDYRACQSRIGHAGEAC